MTRPKYPDRRAHIGRASRFTATEIELVRIAYAELRAAERRRLQLLEELGMTIEEFRRYGIGLIGKKPRDTRTKHIEQADWISTERRPEP